MDLRVNDGWRAHAEYRLEFDRIAVWLANGAHILQPVSLEMRESDPHVTSDPAFYLPKEAARELYDALGRALEIHLSDTRLAAKTLELEQLRVDKFIKFVTERPL